jgi:hypothetical protein
VTAILTHHDALSYVDDVPDVPNASWGEGYELVARTPDGSSVWRVVSPASPALALLTAGFGDPEAPDGDFVGVPLTSAAGVGYIELRAKAPSVVRLLLDGRPPAGEPQRLLRVADAERELGVVLDGRTQPSFLVAVPRGVSRLTLKTDPAATSVDDALQLATPRAELAAAEPDLIAELVSPDPGF